MSEATIDQKDDNDNESESDEDFELPPSISDNSRKEFKNRAPTDKKAKTSSFLVTVDLPYAIDKLTAQDYKKYAKDFMKASSGFSDQIQHFTRKFPGRREAFKIPKVLKISNEFEIGTKHNHLHSHFFVSFDSVCFMDNSKIESFFKQAMSVRRNWLGTKRPYVSSRSMLSDETVKNYITKGHRSSQ